MTHQLDGSYRLINPLTIAHFTDKQSAGEHLEQINRLWSSDHDLDEMQPVEGTNSYNLLYAGERRLRAIKDKMTQISINDALVSANIAINPSVQNTFPEQFLENNARLDVPSADEAVALKRYVDFMHQEVPGITNKMLASEFGISESKFYSALTYTSFPESLQRQINDFPYSWIVDAKPIFDVAQNFYTEFKTNPDKHPHIGEDVRMMLETSGVDELAAHETTTWLVMKRAEQVRRRQTKSRLSTDPDTYADKLHSEMAEGSLFDVFDAKSRDLPSTGQEDEFVGNTLFGRRKNAVSSLASAAFDGLALAHTLGFTPNDAQVAIARRSVRDC